VNQFYAPGTVWVTEGGCRLTLRPDGMWYDTDSDGGHAGDLVLPSDPDTGRPGNGTGGTLNGGTRWDVMASVNAHPTGGSDGAYDLVGQDLPWEEVVRRLGECLRDGFGIGTAKGGLLPSRLHLAIGPAGTYEELPML
jgi:hypothetical protein